MKYVKYDSLAYLCICYNIYNLSSNQDNYYTTLTVYYYMGYCTINKYINKYNH